MTTARIITRSAEDALPVAERLRAQGYTVETVPPGDNFVVPADIEIRIDECAAEEALILAAEMAPENARIFVANGAINSATQRVYTTQRESSAEVSRSDAARPPSTGNENSSDLGEAPEALTENPQRGWLASLWHARSERKAERRRDEFAPTFTDVGPARLPSEASAVNESEQEQARLAAEQEQARLLAEQEQARLAAEQERARRAELRRQAEAERVRLAEEASRIEREEELERQRGEAERERLRQEAEAERLRQEFEARRLRELAETELLRQQAEAAQARAAALRELQERRRAEAEAQRRAEEEQARRFAEAQAAAEIRLEPQPVADRDVASYVSTTPPVAGRDVASYVSTAPPLAAVRDRAERPRAQATIAPRRVARSTPKPRAAGRLRQREREWRVAIIVAAVFAVLLMLGWSAVQNPQPASPLSSSDLTKSTTIQQEVPFGPVTLPAPPAAKPAAVAPPARPAQPAAKAKPPAMKSTKPAKTARRTRQQSRNDDDEVVVRHFAAPQSSARPRSSQAELRVYSDQ